MYDAVQDQVYNKGHTENKNFDCLAEKIVFVAGKTPQNGP